MTTAISGAARALDASSVVQLLGRRPRVLALGEPTHGEDDLLAMRNDLFVPLVEQEGYRTIAVESDCLAGLLVDDHVTTGAGDLDDVVARGFSHGWGAFAGNRELVRRMRAVNEHRPASERVRFAGFDGPLEITAAASARHALTALHDHLATRLDADLLPATAATLDGLLGADDRWTEPAAMFDASRSVGRTPEAQRLRLLADDLVALLEAHTPHLVATSSPEEWHRARLCARTAVGLLRYHAAMADPSPQRLVHLLGIRASIMGANLLALAERGPVLVFAQNAHLQRAQSSMRMGGALLAWWSAGAIVDAHLRDDYAFLATALGTIRHQGVEDPPPDTLEGRLHGPAPERSLLDPVALAAALGDVPRRESPWFGYAPLDPAHLTGVDAVVYVRDVGGT